MRRNQKMQLRRRRMEEKKKSGEFSVLEPREECVLWRAREVAAQVLLDGQVNWDQTTEIFNVKVIGDSSKNLFSGVVEAQTWLEIVQDKGRRGFGDRVYNNSFKEFCSKVGKEWIGSWRGKSGWFYLILVGF